jgi:hypothetical protein
MQATLSKNVTLASKLNAKSVNRSSRRSLVVRAEGKVSHGKGGEEGGATFNNDAFGMVAKNANYMLFAAAVSKVCDLLSTSIRCRDRARAENARRPTISI